jgi:hypothetical protein
MTRLNKIIILVALIIVFTIFIFVFEQMWTDNVDEAFAENDTAEVAKASSFNIGVALHNLTTSLAIQIDELKGENSATVTDSTQKPTRIVLVNLTDELKATENEKRIRIVHGLEGRHDGYAERDVCDLVYSVGNSSIESVPESEVATAARGLLTISQTSKIFTLCGEGETVSNSKGRTRAFVRGDLGLPVKFDVSQNGALTMAFNTNDIYKNIFGERAYSATTHLYTDWLELPDRDQYVLPGIHRFPNLYISKAFDIGRRAEGYATRFNEYDRWMFLGEMTPLVLNNSTGKISTSKPEHPLASNVYSPDINSGVMRVNFVMQWRPERCIDRNLDETEQIRCTGDRAAGGAYGQGAHLNFKFMAYGNEEYLPSGRTIADDVGRVYRLPLWELTSDKNKVVNSDDPQIKNPFQIVGRTTVFRRDIKPFIKDALLSLESAGDLPLRFEDQSDEEYINDFIFNSMNLGYEIQGLSQSVYQIEHFSLVGHKDS